MALVKRPLLIVDALHVAWLGTAAYLVATTQGPARALSEMQLEVWRTYQPIASLAALEIPALIVVLVLQGVLGTRKADDDDLDLDYLLAEHHARDFLWAGIAVAACLAAGGWLVVRGFRGGDLVDVDAADLERTGVADGARYRTVHGVATDSVLNVKRGGKRAVRYVGLRSRDGEAGPARLFVELPSDDDAERAPNEAGLVVTGVVEDAVPNQLRAGLDREGVQNIAPDALFLRQGSPGRDQLVGAAVIAAGLALGAFELLRRGKKVSTYERGRRLMGLGD